MKWIVATDKIPADIDRGTEDKLPLDFTCTSPGELLGPPSISTVSVFVGLDSRKVTTWGEVVEVGMTPEQMEQRLRDSDRKAGFDITGIRYKPVIDWISAIIGDHAPGTLIGRVGRDYGLRPAAAASPDGTRDRR